MTSTADISHLFIFVLHVAIECVKPSLAKLSVRTYSIIRHTVTVQQLKSSFPLKHPHAALMMHMQCQYYSAL